MRLKKALSVLSRFREEFSFVRGNYLLPLITWMILGLVGEIPNTYYGLYVIELGGLAFIIGMIEAVFNSPEPQSRFLVDTSPISMVGDGSSSR